MDPTDFIRREFSRPAGPGACARMVDRWIAECTGQSALSRFGRDYHSEAEVQGWLNEPGGLAVAFNRVMRAAGIVKTKNRKPGDVALAFLPDGRLCACIVTRSGVVSRDENGRIFMPHDAIWKAWGLA